MPGPKDLAKTTSSPLDTFSLFITDAMIDIIVAYINVDINVRCGKYKDALKATISKSSAIEIKALISLLYSSAAMKDNHLATSDLFDEKLCGSNYKSVMSEARFKFLVNCLRFGNKNTRDERKKTDSFASIRKYGIHLLHCNEHYKPGSYMTIEDVASHLNTV
ncbi:Transposase IS4 [Popillia japonica]|uniref:Transposase IS4 n=1 Tax=Popillia japonica TaxID=7064 RepID=A0AAW1LQ27_POPJA